MRSCARATATPVGILLGLSALVSAGVAGATASTPRWISFALASRTGAHLYVAHPDGTSMRRLENRSGDKQDPDWSPDGRRVAVRWLPHGDYSYTPILILDLERKTTFNLSKRTGIAGFAPSWSPDGRRLALAGKRRGAGRERLYVMKADGTEVRVLSPAGTEVQYPAWSPDGRRIAFVAVVNGGFDIYAVDADGRHLARLTSGGGYEQWPMWSPDSQSIAYGVENDSRGRSGIWLMRADGSHRRFLTGRLGVPGSWEPGSLIVAQCFGRTRAHVGVCALDPHKRRIRRLLGSADAGFPAWVPPRRGARLRQGLVAPAS